MKTINNKLLLAIVATGFAGSLAVAPAFAETSKPPVSPNVSHNGQWQGRDRGSNAGIMNDGMMRPGIFGSVTSINGSTLTIVARSYGQNAATTTYSVDASHATVIKANATSTLASVAIGDKVSVLGTVSGTNVTAKMILDGLMPGIRKPGTDNPTPSKAPAIKGNGQPIVAGTVSAVNGSSVSITTTSGTSYSIDASAATITKAGATSTVSAIATGDYLVVQGAVNGSSVTASSIIDGQISAHNPGSASDGGPAYRGGFFGSIGNFFKSLFGF